MANVRLSLMASTSTLASWNTTVVMVAESTEPLVSACLATTASLLPACRTMPAVVRVVASMVSLNVSESVSSVMSRANERIVGLVVSAVKILTASACEASTATTALLFMSDTSVVRTLKKVLPSDVAMAELALIVLPSAVDSCTTTTVASVLPVTAALAVPTGNVKELAALEMLP